MPSPNMTSEFLRLLTVNRRRIHAFILGMVINHADAEDLLQETIVVMWSKYEQAAPIQDFAAWGVTIAKFLILDFRKKRARSALQFSSEVLELLQEESMQRKPTIDRRITLMRGCVGKLNQRDGRIICMRYEEGLTVKAIAQTFNHSVQSIYKHLGRIHEALVQCVQRAMRGEDFA